MNNMMVEMAPLQWQETIGIIFSILVVHLTSMTCM